MGGGGEKRRVLIIGGGFSGIMAARDLAHKFHVTVVDCKEFFEYTPGILRAFVKPAHFDNLTFTLQEVLEHHMGVKFIWGEVKSLSGEKMTATIKPICIQKTEEVTFDYCMVAAGCNFNFLHKYGESLWFPTVHEEARPHSNWTHIDERYIEGRRRHILEENAKIAELNKKGATILVSGAGFIGVEWATELAYFFPKLKISIIDFLPNCLGPLPPDAQAYCEEYMKGVGIKMFWSTKYEPNKPEFWNKIGLPNKADATYICMGVKASNYFMPSETLSDKGPGGGGWIYINKKLQVTDKNGKLFGNGCIWAVGDCNFGCVGGLSDWQKGEGMPPIPKISYPAEEQTVHAVKGMEIMDNNKYKSGGCLECLPKEQADTWWPWGAGMFATSLGPHDACFVIAATHVPKSGYMVLWGWVSAYQKELIETTKIDECKHNLLGSWGWHFVHHTPIHLWGQGAFYK
jgi:NADH dehydrogenase FAD-containing subunit